MNLVRVSKFLSLVLRHHPERINLKLDSEGWANVNDLIQRAKKAGIYLDEELIEKVVSTNDKKRFTLTENGDFIRANQGHSVDIDLGLTPKVPPEMLYHGTASRFIDSIRQKGLIRGQRNHVHLSGDRKTAQSVGERHGKPTVLEVKSGLMSKEDKKFYLSDNGVWLTEHVPAQYIVFS